LEIILLVEVEDLDIASVVQMEVVMEEHPVTLPTVVVVVVVATIVVELEPQVMQELH